MPPAEFPDANKKDMAEYVDWAIRLCAPGALITGGGREEVRVLFAQAAFST